MTETLGHILSTQVIDGVLGGVLCNNPSNFCLWGKLRRVYSLGGGGGGRKAENLKFRCPETQLREQFFLNYTVHKLT